MSIEVLAGAEPASFAGGPLGALVLHGITGSPQSLRGIATALADEGLTVELPLLPGHGTRVEDLEATRFHDWLAAAEAAYAELSSRVEKVIVVGLSMGGTLTASLAATHPEIAGAVLINPFFEHDDQEMVVGLRALVEAGETLLPGIGSDIADPDAAELAYAETPLLALLSLVDAGNELCGRLGDIRCPILIFTSLQDHVVPPHSSDVLAAKAGGPVERVILERSYHVATLDYDRDEIVRRTVEFARRFAD